jgi:hypothetical protein
MDTDDIVETIARNGTDPTIGAAAAPRADEVDDADATSGAPDVASGFLSELTDAMMGVVGKERDRIDAIVEADAAAHLVDAKERAAAEAAAFRQIADEDVASIEGWADAEVERIRADAARRIAERRSDLDSSLAQQEAILDNELRSIETAVADYEVTLQSYLDELRSTGNPAEIAERAHSLPPAPALDDVRAVARADALTRIAEAAVATPDAESPIDATTDDETTGAAETAGDGPAGSSPLVADDASIGAADGNGGTAPADEAAAAGIPVLVDAGSAGRTGWETDDGLEALIDPPAKAVDVGPTATGTAPVAVMDPAATAALGWESVVETPVTTAVATAERSDVGHPNAAVRLIRSVAPWTAPTHPADRTDTHSD